jgi:nucleoside-diphosphate-sugar epimerase
MNHNRECIAITGAAGFIGTHLLEHLSQCSDLRFRLLVHINLNVPLSESQNVLIFHGNLLELDTLDGFPETGCVVVNLAYLGGRPLEENLAAIENLLESCKRAKIKRLIHCSTATVSGRVATNKITENTSENPLQEYEITKSRVERLILEKSDGVFEAVILRPTAVFGKGGRNLIKLMEDLRHGNRVVNYLKSCIYQYRRMNLVCIDNVVSAIEFLIRTNRNIGGETFIISDDADPSNNYRDIEKYLMRKMDCKEYFVPPVSLPFPLLRSLLRLAGRTNDNPNLVYDCGKIISAGFKKTLTFQEGLSTFSDWYIKAHCPDQHHVSDTQ